MDQNSADTTGPVHGDFRTIESGLKSIWERARRAAEMIAELRAEKRDLQSQVSHLSDEVRQLRDELLRKEQLLKKLGSEAVSSRGGQIANGERDALIVRVKELLAKIESHL